MHAAEDSDADTYKSAHSGEKAQRDITVSNATVWPGLNAETPRPSRPDSETVSFR
jgi:hypothetical protein